MERAYKEEIRPRDINQIMLSQRRAKLNGSERKLRCFRNTFCFVELCSYLVVTSRAIVIVVIVVLGEPLAINLIYLISLALIMSEGIAANERFNFSFSFSAAKYSNIE